MCTNKANKDPPLLIINLRDEPVFIATNIKYNPVLVDNTGLPKMSFYLVRILPVFTGSFSVPCLERLFRIRIALPELSYGLLRYNSHIDLCKDTKSYHYGNYCMMIYIFM